jgi:hypothetical protein
MSPGAHTLPVEAALARPERELLALLVEDGWPLVILRDRPDVQTTALSLLRRGLADVYGRPHNAGAVPSDKAEEILGAPESWDPGEGRPVWIICATAAGNALLASDR